MDSLVYTLKYILRECQGASFTFEEVLQKALEEESKECACCSSPLTCQQVEEFTAFSRAEHLLKELEKFPDCLELIEKDTSIGGQLFRVIKNAHFNGKHAEAELHEMCNKLLELAIKSQVC